MCSEATQVDNLATMAVSAAVVPSHPADKASKGAVALVESIEGLATGLGTKKLPSARSLSITVFRSGYARSFLSQALSYLSCVSHMTTSACMQPY